MARVLGACTWRRRSLESPLSAVAPEAQSEAVLDGKTGFLVNPESSEDVAQAVLAILGDPALAARMGAAGRKWALDEFSEEALSKSLKELLRPFGIENEGLPDLIQARRQP